MTERSRGQLASGGEAVGSFATIRYRQHDGIGTLALHRPSKHNAQNPTMWEELRALGSELVADTSLRCLVVAGDGPSFSSGIDLDAGLAGLIGEIADMSSDDRALRRGLEAAGTFSWIPRLGCPSIAAVHGHAYGAGLQLALACDLRVFGAGATVGLTETRYGILPDMGATVRLARLVGESRARELILFGTVVGAVDALRIGLADRVVDDPEVRTVALDLAATLAARSPVALAGVRRALDAAWTTDPDDALAVAVREQLRCLRSPAFRAALAGLRAGREGGRGN